MIGTPTESEINEIPREKSQKFVRSLPRKSGKKFEAIFPKATSNGY
jgi:hypothetical protein